MIQVIDMLFTAYQLAILGRVLYSWIDQNPYPTNPIKEFLWTITEPVMEPLRRVIPPLGMFDLSPIAALFLVQIVHRIVISALDPYGGF